MEENKETHDLLSLQIKFVCGICQQIPQIFSQIWQESYIFEFSSKNYTSYI
jgi:hypothetical protein